MTEEILFSWCFVVFNVDLGFKLCPTCFMIVQDTGGVAEDLEEGFEVWIVLVDHLAWFDVIFLVQLETVHELANSIWLGWTSALDLQLVEPGLQERWLGLLHWISGDAGVTVGDTRKIVLEPLDTSLRVAQSFLVAIQFLEYQRHAVECCRKLDALVLLQDLSQHVVAVHHLLVAVESSAGSGVEILDQHNLIRTLPGLAELETVEVVSDEGQTVSELLLGVLVNVLLEAGASLLTKFVELDKNSFSLGGPGLLLSLGSGFRWLLNLWILWSAWFRLLWLG